MSKRNVDVCHEKGESVRLNSYISVNSIRVKSQYKYITCIYCVAFADCFVRLGISRTEYLEKKREQYLRASWRLTKTYTMQSILCMKATSWWRHQMETFSALLAICAGNSPVPGEFPTQRPVTRSFGVYFDLRPNKRLSKQSWGWWFETLSCPLWRHRNER